MNLPTDRPRPAVQSFRGARLNRLLPRSLLDSLLALGQSMSATLFMTLLAGWQALLHWSTGQDDIVVGTDVANRTRGETEQLIGFFVNQLVLRGDLSGDPSFRDLLARAQRVALDSYAHQDLPFEKLVEILRPARDRSRTPLFQVKIVLHNTPMTEITLPGLSLSMIDIDNRTAKFDLLLNLAETEEGLQASVEYSTDLFDASTIERMVERYAALLEQAADHPDMRLAELMAWLTAREQERQMRQTEQHKAARQHKLKQIQRNKHRDDLERESSI